MIDHIKYTPADAKDEPRDSPGQRLHKAIIARAIDDSFGLVSLQNQVANDHEIAGAQRLLTGQNPAIYRICECADVDAGALMEVVTPMVDKYRKTGIPPDFIQARMRNGRKRAA